METAPPLQSSRTTGTPRFLAIVSTPVANLVCRPDGRPTFSRSMLDVDDIGAEREHDRVGPFHGPQPVAIPDARELFMSTPGSTLVSPPVLHRESIVPMVGTQLKLRPKPFGVPSKHA